MKNENFGLKPAIVLVGFENQLTGAFADCDFCGRQLVKIDDQTRMFSLWNAGELNVAAIICRSEITGNVALQLADGMKKMTMEVPLFLVTDYLDSSLRQLALKSGIADVFRTPADATRIEKRVNFVIDHWVLLNSHQMQETHAARKIGFGKRTFDIIFSLVALLLLSPVFLIVYALVRLESKGPAFYYSPRVGAGYRVFKFYKFRSMYSNADQTLKDLAHLNQYGPDTEKSKKSGMEIGSLCDNCAMHTRCSSPLYADSTEWCQQKFDMRANGNAAFFKIKNDPRITRVGNFIRNTSIDELPQLWNVLKGDMSIVGNRPLPMYEAEKLTSDKYAQRFLAPAGITGLWQVEKRGKVEVSQEERLMLDNAYAQNYSLKNDLRLIIKTIPALFQKESV